MIDSFTALEALEVGREICIRGRLLAHNNRCWLAPLGSGVVMESQKRSILFRLPGLGAELWNHPFTRKTNGSPSLSVDAIVVGIVGKSSIPPFDYEFSTVRSLKVIHDEKESSIDLFTLTDLSDFEMKCATDYPEGPHRQAMFEKLCRERKAW